MVFVTRKICAATAIAVAALLAACGGGNGASDTAAVYSSQSQSPAAAPAAPELLKLESRVQPATAPQGVSPIEKRAVATVTPPAAQVALGPLSAEKSAATDSASGALKIGIPREVAATATVAGTQAQLQWQATPSGGKVAAIRFSADGAKGLRLGVVIGKLPGSAILRLYSQADRANAYRIAGQEVLKVIDRNLASGDASDAARTWWSPDLGGSDVTFELELPPGVAPETVQISIPTLSHVFVDLSLASPGADQAKALGDSGSCNLDATCYPEYDSAADAVARMTFVDGGVAYQCTGTLLNNSANDGAPYFLSGNHCISTQAAASTLQTDWFYRSPSCGSRTLSSARTVRYGGASLLYASADTDTAFMLLNDAPPANTTFAGWDASAAGTGAAVASLHQPSGDLLKISFGNVTAFSSCTPRNSSGNFSCSAGGTSGYMQVRWSNGTTEGGSSGAALFASSGSSRYVIGTLYGGGASCQSLTSPDYFGRFDVPYNAALKNWLNAPATGPGPAGRVPIYRFYNAGTGAHFYTASAGERDFVIANNREFAYEGPVFQAYAGQAAGQSPVFRFYNPTTRSHFYTINPGERDLVLQNPAWQFEGTSWFAQQNAGNGASPIYRFYKTTSGTHFYTISAQERNGVIEGNKEYKYEGIGYYGWTGG